MSKNRRWSQKKNEQSGMENNPGIIFSYTRDSPYYVYFALFFPLYSTFPYSMFFIFHLFFHFKLAVRQIVKSLNRRTHSHKLAGMGWGDDNVAQTKGAKVHGIVE